MALSIEVIVALYRAAGAARPGPEGISPEQHALRCGELAEQGGGAPELVAAALLHDLGDVVAVPFLRGVFPDSVTEPIRLHVDAKRYLCAAEAGYRESLSPASRRSLELRGGAFTTDEAQRFIAQPFGAAAVAICRWDECARSLAPATRGWGHFRGVLEQVHAQAQGAGR